MKGKLIVGTGFILFFYILVHLASATTVILGEGANFTDGTIIRLNSLNCNLTIVNDHIFDKVEVDSTYLMVYINSTLGTPSFISGLPYNYSSTAGTINITCPSNTTSNLTINTTTFDDGIEVHWISESCDIINFSWVESNYNLSLTVNASTGTNSTVLLYWPYTFAPHNVSCSGCSAYSSSFNPTTNITNLTATHSSPVTWIMYSYLLDGYSCTSDDECAGGYCCNNLCSSSSCPGSPTTTSPPGGGYVPTTTTTTTTTSPNATTTTTAMTTSTTAGTTATTTTTTTPGTTTTTIPEKILQPQSIIILLIIVAAVVLIARSRYF